MEDNKILLVDSEKNILLTYKNLLEEENYHVSIAESEKEAIEILTLDSFGILITEFYLKGKDTLSLIKSVQKTAPDTYTIMLTATPLSVCTYEDVIEAGVQDCFFKMPFRKVIVWLEPLIFYFPPKHFNEIQMRTVGR